MCGAEEVLQVKVSELPGWGIKCEKAKVKKASGKGRRRCELVRHRGYGDVGNGPQSAITSRNIVEKGARRRRPNGGVGTR